MNLASLADYTIFKYQCEFLTVFWEIVLTPNTAFMADTQSAMYVCSVLGRLVNLSILVVLTHSYYHIKENLPKEGGFPDPLYCFG